MRLKFDPQWTSMGDGEEVMRHTSALLGIEVGGHLATRVEDRWSRSVTDRIHVSSWPLALWLAANWWRLRWEQRPSARPSVDWRLAHQLVSAGHGFVWPRLEFAPDGETVEIRADPAPATEKQPYGYLDSFTVSISGREFERAVDEFIDVVIARLGSLGVEDLELPSIWNSVRAERADAALAEVRRLEAMLGFDPEEAPEGLVEKLIRLRPQVGDQAVFELAPVCGGSDAAERLRDVLAVEQEATVRGRMELPSVAAPDPQGAPWERGKHLALELRKTMGRTSGPLSSDCLAELLGVSVSTLREGQQDKRLPIGLAVRSGEHDFKYAFRKRLGSGRRFEAARWIAGALVFRSNQRWLPVTDASTAHQKIQRAFAAELLAPVADLKQALASDFSDAAIEEVADEFDVSPLVVSSQLANNLLIPRTRVGDAWAGVGQP